jgi:hypothetical protein
MRRISHIFLGKTQIPLTHPDLKIPNRQNDIPTCRSAMAPGFVLAQASPCKKQLLLWQVCYHVLNLKGLQAKPRNWK